MTGLSALGSGFIRLYFDIYVYFAAFRHASSNRGISKIFKTIELNYCKEIKRSSSSWEENGKRCILLFRSPITTFAS